MQPVSGKVTGMMAGLNGEIWQAIQLSLGPDGPGGYLASFWGARTLAFSFGGLVIGSVLYSLPFAVQPIRNAFEALGDRPFEVAATLRASPWRAFWTVAVPLARPGFLTGAILAFAHSIGEFGYFLRSLKNKEEFRGNLHRWPTCLFA